MSQTESREKDKGGDCILNLCKTTNEVRHSGKGIPLGEYKFEGKIGKYTMASGFLLSHTRKNEICNSTDFMIW